jgi:hypothetical protein
MKKKKRKPLMARNPLVPQMRTKMKSGAHKCKKKEKNRLACRVKVSQ